MANPVRESTFEWAKVLKFTLSKVADFVFTLVLGKLLSDFGRPLPGIFLRFAVFAIVTVLFIFLLRFIKDRWHECSYQKALQSNAGLICVGTWFWFTVFFFTTQVSLCTPTSVNVTQIGVLGFEDTHESVKNLVWTEDGGEQTLGVSTSEAVYIYRPAFVPILGQLWIDRREIFRGRTNGLALDPQGQYLAYGVGTNIFVRDLQKNDIFPSLEHPASITSLDYSPKGEWLASASEDGTIKIWRRIGKLSDTLRSKAGGVTILKYQPVLDGKIAYGTEDGKVFLIDPRAKEQQYLVANHAAAVTSLSFDQSGRRLMSSSLDGMIKLVNVNTGSSLLTISVNTPVLSATFFGDEQGLLVAAEKDGTVAVWDSNTGGHKKDLTGPSSMPAYSVSAGFSNKVLTFGKGTDRLSFWGLPLAHWWKLFPDSNCP